MPESTIDRILDVLDVGLQHSTEHGYPVPPAPGDIDHEAPEPFRWSAIGRVWLDRIDSGRFTKGQCQQFTSSAARLARGYDARGKRSNLSPAEARALVEALHVRGGVLLTPEHFAQGEEWLHRYGPKVLGVPAEIVDRLRFFTYRGDVHLDPEYPGSTLPIWRAHLSDGRAFDYYNAAWQANPSATGRAWWWATSEETTP